VLADQPTDEMVDFEGEDGISDETLVSVIPSKECPEINLLEHLNRYAVEGDEWKVEEDVAAPVVHEKVLLRLSSDVAYSLQELLEESDYFGELRYGYEMVLDPQQLMKKKIQTLNDNVRKRHVCGSIKSSDDSTGRSSSVNVGKNIVMKSAFFSSSDNVPDGYIATRLDEEDQNTHDKSKDGVYVFSISAKDCSHHILRVRDSNKEDTNDIVFSNIKDLKPQWTMLQHDMSFRVISWKCLVNNGKANVREHFNESLVNEFCVHEYLRKYQCERRPNFMVVDEDVVYRYDKNDLYVISKRNQSGHGLWNRIETTDHIEESEARYWSREILKKLNYLHYNIGIAHRNLNPDSLLLIASTCVFCDLGCAVRVPYSIGGDGKRIYEKLSLDKTPDKMDKAYLPYTPPEIVHNMRETYDMFAVDLWSFGISVLNMLLGSIPFESPPDKNYYDQYVDRLSIRMRVARELGLVSDAALDFIHKLLYTNPDDRLTAEQALEHDWICSDDGYVHLPS